MREPSIRKSIVTGACLLQVILLGGCPLLMPPTDDMKTLSLSFSGLESLGDDFVYEGWLLVDGAPVSAGRFSVDADGMPSPASFEVASATADAATLYILTIEPASNDDPAPADTHILAGAVSNGVATISIDHAAALGTDFADAAGDFILETPSTGSIADDFAQGIWWLDPAAGPGAALDLPMLPDGWVYEGWVVGDDGPVSTGRFLTAAGADDDGVGPTGGLDDGPPFPGQDFIDPAVNLVGHAAVISVEPEPDNSAGPFTLKPLSDMNIEDVGAGVLQAMVNMAADTSPTGTVTIAD